MGVPVSQLFPWEHVVWSVGKATDNILSSDTYYSWFQKRDGKLKYKSERAYTNVVVHTAKRIGWQLAEHYTNVALEIGSGYINNALRWFGHKKVREQLKQIEAESATRQKEIAEYRKKKEEERKNNINGGKVYDDSTGKWVSVIDNGAAVDNELGTVTLDNGKTIRARDKYGRWVQEALSLAYDGEIEKQYTFYDGGQTGLQKQEVKTKTVAFFDLNAQVSQTTSKNIILNKVEGRDYTRKELVSGGDICFSIQGEVNSNEPGVYPSDEVKKLINICQYNGVVRVNHLIFQQFNVKNIIIQDFKLDAPTFKNIQPYSITCVAVEPDEKVVVEKDTIQIIDDAVASAGTSGWYKALLETKKEEINTGRGERNKFSIWLSNHI